MNDETGMDLLLGAQGAVAKFPELGAIVAGKVLAQKKRQSTDVVTNKPKFWDNGDPVWEIVMTLQTSDRDAEIEDDDGIRRLFVRGQMLKAVRDAITEAKWRKPLIGGTLKVKFYGEEPPKNRAFSPTKLYKAIFEPPEPADEFDDGQPAPTAEEQYEQFSDEPF